MGEFKVIQSKSIEKEHKSARYGRALRRFIENHIDMNFFEDRDLTKKLIFLEVKYLATYKDNKTVLDEESASNTFSLFCGITDLMAKLTPKEFMQMFPIDKEYDGKKYEMKDYFTTMEEIKKFDLDTPIGEDRIMRFLWDYWNWVIMDFEVNKLGAMSNLRRAQGGKGVMEEFLEEHKVPTYSFYSEQGIMIDRKTGECIKVKPAKKRKPVYLKVMQ